MCHERSRSCRLYISTKHYGNWFQWLARALWLNGSMSVKWAAEMFGWSENLQTFEPPWCMAQSHAYFSTDSEHMDTDFLSLGLKEVSPFHLVLDEDRKRHIRPDYSSVLIAFLPPFNVLLCLVCNSGICRAKPVTSRGEVKPLHMFVFFWLNALVIRRNKIPSSCWWCFCN